MAEKLCGIYKIENLVNHKVYIGQSIDITKRFYMHRHELKYNKHQNEHLQRSYNKYGKENFKHEDIEMCESNLLDERERYWIDYYDSTNREKGYNIESGGSNTKNCSEETKNKLRLNHIGMYEGELNPMYGKHHTKIVKQRISKLNSKSVICITTGEVFSSIQEAAKQYEIIYTAIDNCLRGSTKSSSKLSDGTPLQWDYYDNYIDNPHDYNEYTNDHFNKVICINTNNIFSSIVEAEKYYGIKGISQCCRGKSSYAGIYNDIRLQWVYYEDYIKNNFVIPQIYNNCKKVICITTKKIFNSLKDAGDYYKCDSGDISRCCRGIKKTCGKHPITGEPLHWMYLSDYEELNNDNKTDNQETA